MKKKINLVILLMSLCMILLLALQLYWNYQAYLSNSRIFKSDINDALDKAVNMQINIKRDGFAQLYKKWLADNSLITIAVRYSDSTKSNIFSIRDTHPPFSDRKAFSVGFNEFKLPVKQLSSEMKLRFINHFVKNMITNDLRSGSAYYYTQHLGDSMVAVFNRDRLDMALLKKIYRKELAEHDIENDFELHTAKYFFRGFAADAATINNERTVTRVYKYGFSAPIMAISAYFPQPHLVFLQRMKWVLLASLLLISITIACFTYTVRTMLSQKKLGELKDDFVNNMTHELKTPVATISIAAEAIQDFKVNPFTSNEYLAIIRYQAGNLTHLIDQLLKSMLNERQVNTLKDERFSLTALVQENLHQYQPQLLARDSKMTAELGGFDLFVKGDALHLSNVIANLIDNAIKYSEQPPVITIVLTTTDNQAVLSISNIGPAIPAEYRDRIFDRFFRVPTGNTHNVKGYGLGLSYVKYTVEQHRGRIKLQSENGQNVFTVFLPLA